MLATFVTFVTFWPVPTVNTVLPPLVLVTGLALRALKRSLTGYVMSTPPLRPSRPSSRGAGNIIVIMIIDTNKYVPETACRECSDNCMI